jgi:hypothetical protein
VPARTYGSLFEEKLLERVEGERQRVMQELEGGEAIKTFETYRERVGYLRALRELEEWCSDAETDLKKD